MPRARHHRDALDVRSLLWANARFNLVRLGARVVAFHPHCYGDRVDVFNAGDVTDRVEVRWRLDVPVGSAMMAPADGSAVVDIPRDHPALRERDPAAGAAVRARVGLALAEAFARGDTVLGLADEGYVIGRPVPGRGLEPL